MRKTPLSRYKRTGPVVRTMKDGREVIISGPRGKEERDRRRHYAHWDSEGICILCGVWMDYEECSTEHIIPRGLGGSTHDDRPENLAVSHPTGNCARGSMKLEKYLAKPLEERRRLCGVSR